ncbi:MAG TPA: M14 family metallopeptidase [Vicinamibacteria bacterium]|nr:M14 family metallopeptidase [Vicinamibacteria bacterium]
MLATLALALAADVLPPALPWNGKSETLLLAPGHPWATPFEASAGSRTPSYDETVAFLRRLAAASPELRLVSLGRSGEGRDVWMAVAARGGAATPEAVRRLGKPVLLVQAGIHAGEIDGKDATLMLLRDALATKARRALLDRVSLLFIPILNVDGHERSSETNRINQRGPERMGWRTNATNLNLNRDYAKADTPEIRALLRALDEWAPDLYVDVHVTDGADYEYDVTYGWDAGNGHSPAITQWLDARLRPAVDRDLEAMGHVPGPLIQVNDALDPGQGFGDWVADPRYSNGYGDARHLPTILVENHSLKPFRQRVLGTVVFLDSLARVLDAGAPSLREAVAADEARRPALVPLAWRAEGPKRDFAFKAVEWRLVPAPVAGGQRIEYLGRPKRITVPRQGMGPSIRVERPRAYWIPGAWRDVIERIALHGIRFETITAPRTVQVERYRLSDPRLGAPFEGRVPVTASVRSEVATETFPAASVRVPTDQPRGDLAALLLEPESPDSLFQWGFFLSVLQPTEYVETYVMAPLAERMLAADGTLRAEYESKLAQDPAFAKDGAARLEWLYRRTPYADARHGIYPVARER